MWIVFAMVSLAIAVSWFMLERAKKKGDMLIARTAAVALAAFSLGLGLLILMWMQGYIS